jgi:tripartite-type tricarboxylate transporter receptor subunit TctC
MMKTRAEKTMFKRTVACVTTTVVLAALSAAPVLAQPYPNKPIRVFLGYTSGGASDGAMRPLAKVLEGILGQAIVIEPKPGAAGGVAADQVSKAAADGYTLYFADSGPLTVGPHLNKVAYNPLSSFTHLGSVCVLPSILVAHPSVPAQTVAELVALSKREPTKWSYGTSGIAGPHHMSGEYFKSFTGASLLHIPYKGGAPAMTDLMGGQVPLMFSSLGPAVGPVKNGRIRALAVTSAKRSGAFPDVPTLDEAGLKGFESSAWFGLVGPANMPPEVVQRLSQALQKASEDKGLLENFKQQGCDPDFRNPAATLELVKSDFAKWGKVIKDANIKVD